MPDEHGFLAIGDLACRTGVAPSALRYYERLGLLSPTDRVGGRRHYSPSSLERVAFIRLCRDAGFTLREIGELLSIANRGRRPWGRLAEDKIRELEARISQAERARQLLRHALACPHEDLLTCRSFRAALGARIEKAPARDLQTASRASAGITTSASG
jgi:DNA-binding transcriptional MerR regulator